MTSHHRRNVEGKLIPFKLYLLCFAFALFLSSHVAIAKPNDVVETKDGEDVLELPVRVLQNRYFLKALRPEASLFGGTLLNESYSKTNVIGARLGLFVTESLGMEYAFTRYTSVDSADLTAIRSTKYYTPDDGFTTEKHLEPSFVRLRASHSIYGTFAPVYGKINFLDFAIIYSDIAISAGYSTIDTSQGSKSSFVWGFGERFYFAKSFNVRVDAFDHIFEEERENRGTKQKNTRHAWVVSVGFSAFLWSYE
jgi:outer membrane beta-barrel protein